MKKQTLLATSLFCSIIASAQIYIGKETTVSFFSATSMENIDAINKTSTPVFNTANGELKFRIQNTAFKFKSALMEEHFNENYMESEKFPTSSFSGTILEKIDYSANGQYQATASGKLSIHGVENECQIPGTISVKDGQLLFHSKFPVKLSDYKIKVPSVVGYNIAESIDITVDATLIPYKKKE